MKISSLSIQDLLYTDLTNVVLPTQGGPSITKPLLFCFPFNSIYFLTKTCDIFGKKVRELEITRGYKMPFVV